MATALDLEEEIDFFSYKTSLYRVILYNKYQGHRLWFKKEILLLAKGSLSTWNVEKDGRYILFYFDENHQNGRKEKKPLSWITF